MVRKIVFILLFFPLSLWAQYNTDRLVMIGRSALYYEDYVLSIQYFNQAISAKPYLFEPWYYRAIAKYYLDDYAGAENDCSEAIRRNPYVVGIYELRGLCRIQQKNYEDAIKDYNQALRYEPEGMNLWHNRALCRIQQKDYDKALAEIDTMAQRWSTNARIYAMQSEAYLLQKDTTKAIASLEKSLELDAYNGNTWAMRSMISLAREEWKESEGYLDKAIHLLPKQGGLYINRALARVNQNNLRGAMADYDMALDFEPNNFLGHYNRGLLRAQVGDDNRAITDFDFVLKMEPDNLMALYNRALLLEKTGDPRGAIRDYSKVIDEYPRSDEDIEKYNQLAVADEQEMEHEYQSDYRGRVQNRKVGMDYLPMYALSTEKYQHAVKYYVPYNRQVEKLNAQLPAGSQINIICNQSTLSEASMRRYFNRIDSLTQQIGRQSNEQQMLTILFQRAIAYSVIQNYDAAIDDLTTYILTDSLSAVAYWQRAVCQSRLNAFNASQGTDIKLQTARVLADLCQAIRLDESAYLYYNRGNVHAQRADYVHAIDDYTKAIALDQNLAEAYYNRGLAHLALKHQQESVADLSKAGELGLYQAYSIIKQSRK